jgi:hypothetical protein
MPAFLRASATALARASSSSFSGSAQPKLMPTFRFAPASTSESSTPPRSPSFRTVTFSV